MPQRVFVIAQGRIGSHLVNATHVLPGIGRT